MSVNVRSKPLVRFVVFDGAQSLGVATTHGWDVSAALLYASKRWRMSRDQLYVRPWDECTREERHKAALCELADAQQLVAAAISA